MNQLKSIIHLSQRGYRTMRRNKPLKTFKKNDIEYTEKNLYPEYQEFQPDHNDGDYDPDELDSDFSSVHKSYDEHQRETYRNKEFLKLKIVTRKYFKSNDPNFITWAEREQIKALHSKDSEEWTLDRLSESFPALPGTIKRILKSPHMFSSAEAVIKYDKNVLENWKKFKARNLSLNPRLETHLEKFKDRDIKLSDLESIAKNFVKPEIHLPVPKTNIFTNIVKGYVEQKTTMKDQKKLISNNNELIKNTTSKELVVNNPCDKNKRDTKYATFDKYIEQKIDKIVDKQNTSLENQLMVAEYRNKTSQNVIDNSELSASIKEETLIETKTTEPKKSQVMEIPLTKIETYKNTLETGIIDWKKKSSSEDDNYPKFIKVPKNKSKTGTTFKVNDRYYDSDGEFLYRVPGLNLNSSKT